MSKKLTLEEVKLKTMEILGSQNLEDVSHITQELIDLNYEDEDEIPLEEMEESDSFARVVVYGHNMSYDGNYYRYQRGNNPATLGNACGHVKNKRIPFSQWNHKKLSRKCSHSGTTGHRVITKFIKG